MKHESEKLTITWELCTGPRDVEGYGVCMHVHAGACALCGGVTGIWGGEERFVHLTWDVWENHHWCHEWRIMG